MMIGINMLLWTPHVTEKHFSEFLTLRKLGYDGATLPLFGGDAPHDQKVGRAMKDAGLGCTAGAKEVNRTGDHQEKLESGNSKKTGESSKIKKHKECRKGDR